MLYALSLFAIMVTIGGLVAMLMRAAKANGVHEATHDETQEDLEAVTTIMKEASDDAKLRDKTYRNTLAGIRPNSVRKYDRKV